MPYNLFIFIKLFKPPCVLYLPFGRALIHWQTEYESLLLKSLSISSVLYKKKTDCREMAHKFRSVHAEPLLTYLPGINFTISVIVVYDKISMI